MVKIFLDPGHGGKDPGAVANGLQEKDLVLDIAKRIADKLKQYKGVEIAFSRTTDVFVELVDRAKLANLWRADYFVSLHINAGGGKGGYEDFRYKGTSDAKTIANQKIINEEIVKSIGGINRGTKSADLSVLRNTKMPAILTEAGFIDVTADADKLKHSAFLDEVAQGHVNGLVKIFGLQLKEGVTVAEVKKETVEPKLNKEAQAHWDRACGNGYLDGTRPHDTVKRYEVAIIINRIVDKVREHITDPLEARNVELEKQVKELSKN